MLPGLERLRLAPTGCDDCGGAEPWERRVRQRLEELRATTPDLAPDLVRVVLAAIDTGDAKGACRAASAWCGLNRNHRAACLDAGPVFAALSAAIFTANAPTLVPNDERANFNALCNRIADYEAGRITLSMAPAGDALIRPFVRAAIRHDPVDAMQFATTFRTSRPLMREALAIDGLALQFGFMTDVEMCMIAVASTGLALEFVARPLRKIRSDITLRAVQQNGLALQFALEPVCYEDEVLHAAVRQNGNALMYASQWRSGDYDLVMEAVKNKGGALRWAWYLMQDNENIVRAAVTDDGAAIEYASPRLQANEEIRAIAAAQIRYGASAEGGVVAF
jgi:hypothetical protein